ncbi:MAG: hypothetical protein H6810_10715 [Phycisphaeraceae bacterium]|nr:MAG: hypothetical protein H6810_10715 [Phycisphaeraceae bacterium]
MSSLNARAILPVDGSVATNSGGETVDLAALARSTRVLLLTFALVAMSLLDLYITLLYLQTVGLAEENPFARLVMSHGSAGLLASWKLATMLPTVMVLLLYRRHFTAEVLAWVACGVLLMVTIRWLEYTDQTDIQMMSIPTLQGGADHRWVTLVGD